MTADGRKRLVVINNRGGMDGISAVPPLGDRDYVALRGPLAILPGQALSFDGDFGLHPALAAIHGLAQRGDVRIAPAVATPAGAPNHNDSQNVLETGMATLYAAETGWLNRALAEIGGEGVNGLAAGTGTTPLILRGPVPTGTWETGRRAVDERTVRTLAALYADDPDLAASLAEGLRLKRLVSRAAGNAAASIRSSDAEPDDDARGATRRLGLGVARAMTQDGGPQIAAISIDGWDNHSNEGSLVGNLAARLADLDAVIEGLAEGLDDVWSDSLIVTVTEFGRCVEPNGAFGTEHGYAFASILAGGALKRGGLIGDWPGLAAERQIDGALAPTLDVRALLKGVLHEHLGLDRAALDTMVFPGSAGIEPVRGLA